MSEKVEKAINNHKSFYSCSASVLSAFSEEAGLTGAVLAAEYVIDRKLGENSEPVKAEFERRFTEMNRTLMCKELKGALTGKPIRSCRGCVTDAAELLDELLSKN